MRLPISLFIIFLIVSPFAATADFTTYSAYDSNGNTFSSTEYDFDNDYDDDFDFDLNW